jgi:hypothetical protein
MPVRKDPSGERSVQVEVEVPGSPEEVWKALGSGTQVAGMGRSHGCPGIDRCDLWKPPPRNTGSFDSGDCGMMLRKCSWTTRFMG